MAAAQVSLLMPTFNHGALRNARTGTPLIEEAMASLLQQTQRDLALVILDNQSTDGTVEYCRTRAAADARITVHVDSERRGPEEAIKALKSNGGLHAPFLRTLPKALPPVATEAMARSLDCARGLIQDAHVQLV